MLEEKRLWDDFEKDEKERMTNLTRDFYHKFKMSREQIKKRNGRIWRYARKFFIITAIKNLEQGNKNYKHEEDQEKLYESIT